MTSTSTPADSVPSGSPRRWSAELLEAVGQRVTLEGWLHQTRQLSSVSFLLLRDGSGIAQVVIEDPNQRAFLRSVLNESIIRVTGLAATSPQAPNGVELRDPEVEILVRVEEPVALDLFRPVLKAQLPTILDHAAIALRHPRHRAIFQVVAASVRGFRTALTQRRFVEVNTPKIVASATEGGAMYSGSTTSAERRF